ncbi:hypothetical protein HGM15179_008512 [Zosterops borbonicus]|uniref:Uncharacterized protein n=1 Tax=Zosterops borbonicus TaxID=364589 RepID=A0A8K1GGW3_9PASS|nr:hypothetical protein HGM15179_008512 [Zosterops borbonicus]
MATGPGNRERDGELDSEAAPGTLTRNRNRHRKPALPTAGSCGHYWEWGLAPAGSGKWERRQLAMGQELGTSLVNREPGSRSNRARAPRLGIIQKMCPSVGTGMGNWDYPDTSSTSWELELGPAPAHLELARPLGPSRHWHFCQPCPGTG